MASSYFKLKVLKRKRRNLKRIFDADNEQIFINNKESDVINYYKNKCRICLLDGSISIFSENSIEIREYIKLFGGIEVSEGDSFPEHICTNCNTLLQNAILFRKKAQKSDLLLKNPPTPKADLPVCNNLNSDKNSDKHINNDILDTYCNGNETLNTKDIKYKCKICNKNFFTWNGLILHNNSKQHKNVRIQCRVCNGLLTMQLYKKHLERHHSTSHLVCDVCGKLYRKDNLVRHLQLHSYDLPFRCKVCPYRGRFPESLKIHMRTHTGLKPFSCDKCQLKFLTRSNLNRHLLTHNKQKPFKCGECGRGFHVKRDLEIHFASDHAGIKDFGCKTCNNKYGTRKALMRHELGVHKREKMAKGRMPLYLQAEYKI